MTGKKTASELINESGYYVTIGTFSGSPGGNVPEEKQRERYAKAIELTKAATKAEPRNSSAWLAHSMSLLLLDRYNEAKEAFKKGVGLSNGTISVSAQASKQVIGFALMLEDFGDLESTEQFLIAQTNNAPKSVRGWAELAAFYQRYNKADVSEKVFEKALEKVGCQDILETLLHIRSEKGHRSSLFAALETAKSNLIANKRIILERTEFSDRTREENGVIALAIRFNEDEISKIMGQKKLSHRPDMRDSSGVIRSLTTASGVFFAQGKFKEAETACRQAIKLDPTYAEAWFGLGAALERQNRYPEAEAASRRATELNPANADAWFNLGICIAQQNRYPEAAAALRRATELNPAHAKAWSNLRVVLERQNRYSEDEAACRRATELDPADAKAWFKFGKSLECQSRYPEAEAAFRRAIELHPSDAETWLNLGVALERQKRHSESVAACRRATELNPAYVEAWLFLGTILGSQDRYPEAEAAARRATELNPAHVDACFFLGTMLFCQNKRSEADAVFRRVIELEPKLRGEVERFMQSR